MKTLFGIRSNVVAVAVASLYIIISLHTTIYGIKYFKEYNSVNNGPSGFLLVDTNSDSFHIVSLILSLSCLLSSILLILGVVEKRYGFIRPWLLFNFILECIFVVFLLYLLFLLCEVCKSNCCNACGLLVLIFFVSMALASHTYLGNGIYTLYNKFYKQSLCFYRVPDNEDNAAAVHAV